MRELWNIACSSLCNSNWETYSRIWDKSAKIRLLHPNNGEWLKGWEEIGPHYKQLFDKGVQCEILNHVLELNFSPSGDMAWGTAEIILQYQESDVPVCLWESLVFEKKQEDWK